MRRRALALATLGLAACGAPLEDITLRVEPPMAQLQVDPAAVPPSVRFRVFVGAIDVTSDVKWSLEGTPLGAPAARFQSDGRTGGEARLVASYYDRRVSATIVARVTSRRIVTGAPAEAPRWFDAATEVPFDAALEPGDGVVLPPNLGHLDVDFAANDADDLHEVTLLGPYLDVRIYAAGSAGPRHVELTAAEWEAVSRTSRGTGAGLIVRSLGSAAPATARTTSAHLAIADRDLFGTLIFAGLPDRPDATASLWQYDFAKATTMHWYEGAQGICVSCHLTISHDGARLAAATIPVGSTGITGVIYDTTTRAKLSDDSVAPTWSSAAFDPSGRLVTSWQGALTLRDGVTAAPIAPLPVGVNANQPAIAPDGRWIAYSVPTDPTYPDAIGAEIRIQPFDAATATLGTPRVLVPSSPLGAELPAFSPDGGWVVYSRRQGAARAGAAFIAADGSSGSIEISADSRDGKARWASAVAPTRADGTEEPMAWIVMASSRPVGVRVQDKAPQLWMTAVYPDRRVVTRPFHLPGQPPDLGARHAPALTPR